MSDLLSPGPRPGSRIINVSTEREMMEYCVTEPELRTVERAGLDFAAQISVGNFSLGVAVTTAVEWLLNDNGDAMLWFWVSLFVALGAGILAYRSRRSHLDTIKDVRAQARKRS